MRRGNSYATVSYCAALLPLVSAIQQRDGTSMCIVEDGSILVFLIESYLYEELDIIGTITIILFQFHNTTTFCNLSPKSSLLQCYFIRVMLAFILE